MQFNLATTNAHKVSEFQELFEDAPVDITSPARKLEIVEDGTTFAQNAYKKAFGYFKELGHPAVADDSGLVVPALPDQLGIHSARFAPEFDSYKDKNNKLIELLDSKDRSAYFVCVLCFVLSEKEVYFFEGRVHGQIAGEIKGEHGFGYDPVFEPDGQNGQSMAQIPDWKMQNSHRAKAAKEAVNFFKSKNSIAKTT